MKKILSTVLFITICSALQAQEYRNAIGVRFSNRDAIINTGISFRHMGSNGLAFEGLLSFDPAALGLLVEKFRPLNVSGLQWFYGGGAYVAFEGRNNLGALGILGLDYKFQGVPLNVSIDWKPELQLLREVEFEPAAVGVGVRFTF